jgi:Resolvase, N terminal domain
VKHFVEFNGEPVTPVKTAFRSVVRLVKLPPGISASHSFSTSARGSEFEDQFRTCREHAGREGWQVIDLYQDAVISGASVILRPGIQLLLQNAQRGKFDIVLAEALDRISRDQADVATLFSICALPACESSRWPKAKSPNVMPASKAR